MRMRQITHWIVGAMIVAGTPVAAGATITQTFSNRADFVAATSGGSTLTFNLGASYDAPSYSVGPLTITAPGTNVYGAGNLVSTEIDSNALVFTFSTPITALGLFGGVADENFNYIDGTLSIALNGGATASLTAKGGSAAYLGFISDTAISQVTLSIASFDVNATSAPFATLEQQIDVAGGRDTNGAVPEPATWMMMIVGFGCVGGSLRRTQRLLRIGQPA